VATDKGSQSATMSWVLLSGAEGPLWGLHWGTVLTSHMCMHGTIRKSKVVRNGYSRGWEWVLLKTPRKLGAPSQPANHEVLFLSLSTTHPLPRPRRQLLAILGPSGAGKTSVLDVASGALLAQATGTVCINGTPLAMANFAGRMSCPARACVRACVRVCVCR
jgi:hypothetical protein